MASKDIKKCIDGVNQRSLKTDCLTAKWPRILKLMFLNLLRRSCYMNNNACVCSIWTKVPFAPSQGITTVIRNPIPSNIIAHKFETGFPLDLLEWWLHIRQQARAWLNTWSSRLWNEDRKKEQEERKKHAWLDPAVSMKPCKIMLLWIGITDRSCIFTTLTLTKRQRICSAISNLPWSTQYGQSAKTVCTDGTRLN